MKDIVLFSTTIVAFALFVTTHCMIIFGLARRPPRWRALVAFALVPLAPYWALREGMWGRASVWMVSVMVYVVVMLLQG